MMLRRPARSLWVFLGLVVAVGTLFGHVLEGAAFAVFFLFISSIDAKPAFKAQFDAPGTQDSGRGAGRSRKIASRVSGNEMQKNATSSAA